MFKFLVCSVVVAVASGGYLGSGSGLQFGGGAVYAPHYENYEPHDYQFNYGVSDPHTGDHKSQWEVKEKGVVRGGYSLLEPDGTTRIVEYIADDDGFRAVVKKLGDAHHPDQVEAHGFEEPVAHHQSAVLVQEPIHHIEPESQISYHAYDGQADNYANVLGQSELQHIAPQLNYEKSFIAPQPQQSYGYQQQQGPLFTPQQQEFNYYQPQQHNSHHQIEPVSYQLPYESQGRLDSLQPVNSYPTFSSGQQVSQYFKKPEILAYQRTPQFYSKQAIDNGVLSQPEGFGIPALSHQQEVPIYQGQYSQGVPQQHNIQSLPVSVKSYIQNQPLAQSVDYSQTGNLDDGSAYAKDYGSSSGHEYYQGEYSQKVQKVVLAPSKAQSHFKAEPFRIIVD